MIFLITITSAERLGLTFVVVEPNVAIYRYLKTLILSSYIQEEKKIVESCRLLSELTSSAKVREVKLSGL